MERFILYQRCNTCFFSLYPSFSISLMSSITPFAPLFFPFHISFSCFIFFHIIYMFLTVFFFFFKPHSIFHVFITFSLTTLQHFVKGTSASLFNFNPHFLLHICFNCQFSGELFECTVMLLNLRPRSG